MHATSAVIDRTILRWSFIIVLLMNTIPPLRASSVGAMTVRLLVPSPVACRGQQTLDLEAVLTNSTGEVVELSEDGVAHHISFQKFDNGRFVNATGLLLDIRPQHWVKLAPHQTVVIPFTEPITDKEFSSVGLFTAQIDFGVFLKNSAQYSTFPGSVQSNSALFLVTECSNDPIGADVIPGGLSGPSSSDITPNVSAISVETTAKSLLHESGHALR